MAMNCRKRSQQGFTMLEMMVSIGILLLVLEAGESMLTELSRAARVTGQPPAAIDRACDLLRKELKAPAHLDGGDLITTRSRWHLDGQTLMRNRASVCQLETLTWTIDHGVVCVRLQAAGLPAREIIACQ
jgi:prepilin-type N-terminal cleavage/methylation domain-containing protein